MNILSESQDFSKENEIKEDFILNNWNHWCKNKNDAEYLTMFIRIPFCKNQKCKYCLYTSKIASSETEYDLYLDELEIQIKKSCSILQTPIKSVYIGGGTPSILTLKQLKRLFKIINDNCNIDKSDKNMFSFEASPYTFTKEKIDFIANETFINRISIGIQSLSNEVLEYQNRQQINVLEISVLLEYIKNKFINKNFNVDIIAGLELQNLDIMKNDYQFLSNLDIPKITIYNRKFSSHHNKETQKHLRDNYNKFLRQLMIYIEKDNKYDFEKEITEYAWMNLIHKNNNILYEHIYMDRPINYINKKNSCISFGDGSFSWIGSEFGYYFDNNIYYNWSQFYYNQLSIKNMIENYSFKVRAKYYI